MVCGAAVTDSGLRFGCEVRRVRSSESRRRRLRGEPDRCALRRSKRVLAGALIVFVPRIAEIIGEVWNDASLKADAAVPRAGLPLRCAFPSRASPAPAGTIAPVSSIRPMRDE